MMRQRWPIVLTAGFAALVLLTSCEGAPAPDPPTDQPADTGRDAPARATRAPDHSDDPAVAAGAGVDATRPPPEPLRMDTVTRNREFEGPATPALWAVRVGGDTVWFLGEISRYAPPPPSFGYVRATGEWVRAGPRADLDRGSGPPHEPARDTVEVATGVTLIRRGYETGAGDLVVLADGAVVPVPAEVPPEVKKRLVAPILERSHPRPDLEEAAATFPVERSVSAWTADDSTVWLGRAGMWTEGTGGLGGIVRVDRRDGRVESYWTEHLMDATVTGLALAGDRLWIGTLHPGEYGPRGSTAVLRLDPETGAWDRLTPAGSALPSSLVWGLAGARDTVWIATDSGLAVVDAASGEWQVRSLVPELEGDSVVFALRSGAAPDPVRDVAFVLMERLGVERRAAFLAAARRAPPGPFADVYRQNVGWDRPLADSVFVPFLLEALGRRATDASLALAALGGIPAPLWDPAPVRDILARRDPYLRTGAARALARAGYGDGVEWLRRELRAPSPGVDWSEVVSTLGEIRDTASIPALAEAVEERRGGVPYRALRAMRSDSAWRALLRVATRLPEIQRSLFHDVVEDTLAAPLHDPAFQAAVEKLARGATTAHDDERRLAGAAFLLQRGDTTAVAPILDLLADNRDPWGPAVTLVRITGVDTAPPVPAWDATAADRARALEFWTGWWEENVDTFRPVPRERGLEALRRWGARPED